MSTSGELDSDDTKEAFADLAAELGKAMPDWLALRVTEAVDALILNRLADMAEAAAKRLEKSPENTT